MEQRIIDKLAEIKNFCGLTLTPCDHFTGISKVKGKGEYFNVVLTERANHFSPQFRAIQKLVKKGIVSHVELNGLERVAIFF